MDGNNGSSTNSSFEINARTGFKGLYLILKESQNANIMQRHIVYGMYGVYVLFVGAASEPARLTLEEAATRAFKFLNEKGTFSYSLALSYFESDSDKSQLSSFATIHKVTYETLSTLRFSLEEERQIFNYDMAAPSTTLYKRMVSAFRWSKTKQRYLSLEPLEESQPKSGRQVPGLLYATGASIFICILLFVVVGYSLANPPSGIYVRYDTHNSKGPRYQLQFDHHNVTEWDTAEKRTRFTSDTEWELRIDDQAMIPANLLTAEEERYQRWFRARYPETELIRQQKLYLNESFLNDPYAIQVLSDEAFHMAHCVLAMRRYWWAKESGTHVCPRDIDYRHIKHCLDSLDEMAFPGGVRGPVVHDPEPGDIRLLWETKVCF